MEVIVERLPVLLEITLQLLIARKVFFLSVFVIDTDSTSSCKVYNT